MAQKIRKFNFRSVKRRVAGNGGLQETKSCREEEKMNSASRMRKFSQLEKFLGKFSPLPTGTPATKQDQKLLEVKLEK